MPTQPTPAVPSPAAAPHGSSGFYRLPSTLLKDPLGALIEKEFRFLVRSPRFRLVFIMGFTFGLVLWLPMVFVPRGPLGEFFVQKLSSRWVCVYSLMLMSGRVLLERLRFRSLRGAILFSLLPCRSGVSCLARISPGFSFCCWRSRWLRQVCVMLHMPLGCAPFKRSVQRGRGDYDFPVQRRQPAFGSPRARP